MVAINPKKNLHFGENPPEINLKSNLKNVSTKFLYQIIYRKS